MGAGGGGGRSRGRAAGTGLRPSPPTPPIASRHPKDLRKVKAERNSGGRGDGGRAEHPSCGASIAPEVFRVVQGDCTGASCFEGEAAVVAGKPGELMW